MLYRIKAALRERKGLIITLCIFALALGLFLRAFGSVEEQHLSEQQEALRAVLEECLPKIRDSQLYHLSRQRVRLLNGQVEYVYRYTISNAYKARLSRAPYYDGTLQPRSW